MGKENYLQDIFNNYLFLNIRGKKYNLKEVFYPVPLGCANLINHHSIRILLGGKNYGKTTLLKRVALFYAMPDDLFDEELRLKYHLSGKYMPIYIDFQDFLESQHTELDEKNILQKIDEHINKIINQYQICNRSDDNEILLMIDDFDQTRSLFVDLLIDYLKAKRNITVLIAAYRRIKRDDFPEDSESWDACSHIGELSSSDFKPMPKWIHYWVNKMTIIEDDRLTIDEKRNKVRQCLDLLNVDEPGELDIRKRGKLIKNIFEKNRLNLDIVPLSLFVIWDEVKDDIIFFGAESRWNYHYFFSSNINEYVKNQIACTYDPISDDTPEYPVEYEIKDAISLLSTLYYNIDKSLKKFSLPNDLDLFIEDFSDLCFFTDEICDTGCEYTTFLNLIKEYRQKRMLKTVSGYITFDKDVSKTNKDVVYFECVPDFKEYQLWYRFFYKIGGNEYANEACKGIKLFSFSSKENLIQSLASKNISDNDIVKCLQIRSALYSVEDRGLLEKEETESTVFYRSYIPPKILIAVYLKNSLLLEKNDVIQDYIDRNGYDSILYLALLFLQGEDKEKLNEVLSMFAKDYHFIYSYRFQYPLYINTPTASAILSRLLSSNMFLKNFENTYPSLMKSMNRCIFASVLESRYNEEKNQNIKERIWSMMQDKDDK